MNKFIQKFAIVFLLTLSLSSNITMAGQIVSDDLIAPNMRIWESITATETRYYSNYQSVPKEIYVFRAGSDRYNYAGDIKFNTVLTRHSNGGVAVEFRGTIYMQ